MADEKYISKVIFGGKVLMDLTSDTVTKEKLLVGATAHGKDGALIEGACSFDADTSDATATESQLLEGATAYVNKNKLTGTMKNNGAVSGTITDINSPYQIPIGYHDGSGTVAIDSSESSKITPNNIRKGVTVLGVTGTLEETPGSGEIQAKTVTPSLEEQIIVPDENFAYLSQVTVAAIPYVETENAAGGITVTIAG